MASESIPLTSPGPVVDAEHPWLGLHSYTEETQAFFFGRDAEIRDIFTRVRDQPLTVLYGRSGLGKSSLLRAGLVPKLRVEQYRPVVVRLDYSEGASSLIEQTHCALRAAVPNLNFAKESTLWGLLHQQPSHTVDDLDGSKEQVPTLEDAPPVLIFDQFEEILRLVPKRKSEVTSWFSQIAGLVENSPPIELQERFKQERALMRAYSHHQSPARVVLSLREEYLSDLESWKRDLPSLMGNRMALQCLTGEKALEVAVRPGSLGPRAIVSEEVGAQIVRQIAGQSPDVPLEIIEAIPPYLSLFCEQLNLERERLGLSEITADLVRTRGKDILDQYYEDSFKGQPDAIRRYVEDRLVTDDGYRDDAVLESFLNRLEKAGVKQPKRYVNALVERRLLTIDVRGGLTRVELTHDVLTKQVVRSREARLAQEASVEAEKREREALLEAKSREQEALLEAKQQLATRVRWVTGLSALAVVLAGLALVAVQQRNRANDAAKVADRKANEASEREREVSALKRKLDSELRDLREKIDVAGKRNDDGTLWKAAADLGVKVAECSEPKETTESTCGLRGGTNSHEKESCVVPFVSFDPADQAAYDAVACEFWKKSGIRVKRISCTEESFRDYRRGLLNLYPGGVFTWQPGQSIEPVINTLFRWDPKSWLQVNRETWPPLIRFLKDQELGGIYSVPFKVYPWAIYFHKRFVKDHGPFTYLVPPKNESEEWKVPQTWAELLETAEEFQRKKISAFAFSFAKGHTWTAMGTFDILDMRLHGYEAHEKLRRGALASSEKQAQLDELFRHWAALVPYYTTSWREDTVPKSTSDLERGKVGMYLTGAFFLKYVKERRNDFGLFDFPKIETPTNATLKDTDATDAPIDTLVISAAKDDRALGCAKELVTFLGADEAAFRVYNAANTGIYLPVNKEALLATKQESINTPQRQAARLLTKWNTIAGFTDRRVWGLEGPAVMPALARFLDAAADQPNKDIKQAIIAAISEINVASAAE